MRSSVSIASLVLLVAVVLAGARTADAALGRGTIEITPSLALSRTSYSQSGNDLGTTTALLASGELGYFITDGFEIGGGVLVDYSSFDFPSGPSTSATSLGLVGVVQYHFASSGQMVPFVRAAAGFATSPNDPPNDQTTLIAPILAAGMRVLVGSSGSVNFGVGYQHRSDAGGVPDRSLDSFGLDVGISLVLRPAP